MLSDIGQVVNAAEIIAGEKPVTDLGVTAVDDKTLEVQLNVPVSYFLSLMYFPTFYPVNEAFYNTCADTVSYTHLDVYKRQGLTPARLMRLRRMYLE